MSQYQDGLPQGWAMAEFDDVAEVEANLVEPSAFLDSPHVAPNHIESGTGRLLPYQSIRADGVTSPKHLFRPGQILYSKIRPYLAKVTLVDFAGLCSADMYPVRADIVPGFLQQWLVSPMFTALASQSQSRTVLPKINKRALGTKAVPVPPLNEQKRIVARIEALQLRSSAAKEALDAIPPLLEKFRQSVLAAAFRGDLTRKWREAHPDVEPATELLARIRAERRRRWKEAKPGKKYVEPKPVDTSGLPELPEGWCWASLEELTPADAPVVYGIILPGPHVEDGIPFVRPADIHQGAVDLDALPRTSPEVAEKYRRAALLPGDLVFSIVGTIGKWLITPEWLDGANITQSSVRIRPIRPLTGEFVLRALQAPVVTRQMARMLFGNAVQRLNVEHVRRLALPLPPWSEWREIVQVVRKGVALADAQAARTSLLAEKLSTLNQSILAKAFRGELVPQDPNDEPASVLLERIRQEREAAGHSSATRRRGRKPKQARRS